MYPTNVVKKIPGDLPPLSKKESQGYIDNLSKKQKFELEELLERQNKILNNKSFVAKLPDKGEKIISFRDKVLQELAHRNEVDKAANLLSRLNIASEGKAAMNKLEWTGKYSENDDVTKIVELDSDDEDDPLKILAQPTGTGVHKKKIIHVQSEESLIKPEDIKEIESFKIENQLNSDNNENLAESSTSKIESDMEHVKYIVEKVENAQNKNVREPFKPYKTTKSNVHDPEKEKERKYKKNWEVTAATPPYIVHGAVKTISLNESLQLLKEQADKLQEIQIKHAAEKLAEQFGTYTLGPLPKSIGTYRQRTKSTSSSEGEEEKEVYDDEDEDKRGTVSFTISDHEDAG